MRAPRGILECPEGCGPIAVPGPGIAATPGIVPCAPKSSARRPPTCGCRRTSRTTRPSGAASRGTPCAASSRACPAARLNIAHEAVDRHLGTPVRERVALRFVGRDDRERDDHLRRARARSTNRFANVLRRLGVGKGDRVFLLAGRVPELYVAALGALKNGTVVSPLFSAFGPEPIRTRLRSAQAGCWSPPRRSTAARSRASRRPCPTSSTCSWSATDGARDRRPGHARPRRPDGNSGRRLRDRADGGRRTRRCCTSPAARPARPRARIHVHGAVVDALRDRPVRPRPAPRRHLLVHGRSGLGDRHVLRHHRAAAARRHQHRRRGRLRRRALVPDPAGPAGDGLVHGARPRSAC